jgi:hypothetical protein
MVVKRVFVPESMHDSRVEKLAEKELTLRVGKATVLETESR